MLEKRDIYTEFKTQLALMPEAKDFKRCFDCGACSGICPVSQLQGEFDPRKIIYMIKLGLKERLLSSKAIWMCTHCESCSTVCPQGISFTPLIDSLRKLAIEEGYVKGEDFLIWATAPCKTECPAHISIPGFIGAIQDGRFLDGLRLIKEQMPFPSICGRICPHPCEAKCNRGNLDEPVAIEKLKRFLGDQDILRDRRWVPKRHRKKGKSVAVIGAGPSGLTAGYYLAIKGYDITIFEKLPVAGGMMVAGIPEFRLPKDVISAEVDIIKELGVDIRLNTEVGRDIDFKEIREKYDVVFLGAGCHKAIPLDIPCEKDDLPIVDGVAFLRTVNLGKNYPPKKKVIIIGGGNTAIDCARVCVRLGFKEVLILYRRTRDEMPANPWEVEEALEEGVKIRYLSAPLKAMRCGESGIRLGCVMMEMGEPDESGRRRPVPVPDKEFELDADLVITAIGQQPDLSFLTESIGSDISVNGLVRADLLTGKTDIPGVFAGGDVVTGPKTVVEAVAMGKRAAICIDKYLKGEDILPDTFPNWFSVQYIPQNVPEMQRIRPKTIGMRERLTTFKEVVQGFNEKEARIESGRCLRICGIQTIR